MSDVWYLFDPDHPARAEQAMQRLSVEGRKLVIERGTFGSWQVIRTKRVLTPDAIEDRLADARARGLAVERDPFAVLDRLSARHPELEAAIEAIDDLDSPAGREALEVYADFLQSQGDARGELAAMQLRDRNVHAWRDCLEKHRAQVFGPLADIKWWPSPRLRWRGGWITDVVTLGNRSPHVPIANVLRLPACACVRNFRGAWHVASDALPHCRATIRRVKLETHPLTGIELGELPRLDQLGLHSAGADYPRSIRVASMRPVMLFLHAGTLTIIHEFLDTVAMDPLKRFGFWIPWESRPEELRELLGHPALQSLREIFIGWMPSPWPDRPPGPLEGPMLDAVLEAPLLHRVELRDLSELHVADPQQVLDAFAAAPGLTKVWSPT